mgnify:CR=1 FL=1
MKNINDIAIIVQARLNSERVPKKMIRPFAGSTLVDIFCEKIKRSKVIKKENFYLSIYEKELIDIANKHGVQIFHRSEKSANSEGTPLGEMYEWWNKLPFKYAVLINACAPMLKTETIDDFIKQVPLFDIGDLKVEEVMKNLKFDKKQTWNKNQFILLNDLGSCFITNKVDNAIVKQSLDFIIN